MNLVELLGIPGILSVAAALVVVLLLAGYLSAILWELARTKRNLAALAGGLKAIESNTEPLGERLEAALGGLGALHDHLRTTDENLGDVTRALGLERPDSERKVG